MAQESWVKEQLDRIDAAGDTAAATVMDRPVVVTIQKGAKTGERRRVPLMRVEANGSYAAVASDGGAPKNPVWYNNLATYPDDVEVMDGTDTYPVRARLLEPGSDEYQRWWDLSVEAYPAYADYQRKTDRVIPVFVLEPR